MKKKGEVLIETVIFIILNIIFLSILVLFLLKQGSGAIILEGAYAKEIALLVDSAKPGMILEINMEDAFRVAKDEGIDFTKVVKINNSQVTVHLNEKGGYKYHYFNDINVTSYPVKQGKEFTGIYVLTFYKK